MADFYGVFTPTAHHFFLFVFTYISGGVCITGLSYLYLFDFLVFCFYF